MTRTQKLRWKLRLYIAGSSPNSRQALSNLRLALGHPEVPQHDLEIIDVLRHPERALEDSVIVTPMLIQLSPRPGCRVFGCLSDVTLLLRTLGVVGSGA